MEGKLRKSSTNFRELLKAMTAESSQKGILIQKTEVTSDDEDPKERTDQIPETVKHCDDGTKDILGDKISARGTPDSDTMTISEMEKSTSNSNIMIIQEVEIKHCDDDSEDILGEKIIAGAPPIQTS